MRFVGNLTLDLDLFSLFIYLLQNASLVMFRMNEYGISGKFRMVKVWRSKELRLSFQIEKQNYHAQLTSFCASFLNSLQFFASSCDFCTSSFPLGCLGLNSCVTVYSGCKVDRRFGMQNATFRWRFFYVSFG